MDLKLEESILIYQKPFIKFGMRDHSIKLSKMVSQVMF